MKGSRTGAARLARSVVAGGLVVVVAACTADATPSPRPACPTEPPTSISAQASLEGAEVATLTVSGAAEGSIEIGLLGDVAPLATANFVELARCGFYDGVKFHRVLAGFVIQAGDPNTRDHDGDFPDLGKGGPGYGFEIEPPPASMPFDAYTVAMANNTAANGSQFFITLGDLDQALRQVGTYTIFGDVIAGQEVVDAIATVPVGDPRIGVPVSPITIDSVTIGPATQDE